MADSSVRAVTSNQDDIYKNLEQVVRKYATTRFLRPVADHTREAFESAKQFVQDYYGTVNEASTSGAASFPSDVEGNATDASKSRAPAGLCVILDSGCGTGESTLHLARKFPGVPVIGIDKSAMRLNKAGNEHQLRHADESQHQQSLSGEEQATQSALGAPPANAFWVRAELLDFWRLALDEVQAGRWQVLHHAVYYPNPWPKESEATRRFHLHPIFPTLMALSSTTELRTNWEIYAREFAEAARILQNATPRNTEGNTTDVQNPGVSASSTNPPDVANEPSSETPGSTADATTRGTDIAPPRKATTRSTDGTPSSGTADAPSRNAAPRGTTASISCEPFAPLHPETAFERKYKEARQQLWRVLIKF